MTKWVMSKRACAQTRSGAKHLLNTRMQTMREIMRMVEKLERPRVGPPVPDVLYFGTCERVWEPMVEANNLQGPEGQLVLCTDWHTACARARKAGTKHESKGIVLVINGDDLARKFNVVPLNPTDSLHSESEWKLQEGDSIDLIDRYVTAVEPAY